MTWRSQKLEQVASPNIKAEGENNMKKTHNQARSQRIGIYHTIEIQIFQIFQGSKKFKEWMQGPPGQCWLESGSPCSGDLGWSTVALPIRSRIWERSWAIHCDTLSYRFCVFDRCMVRNDSNMNWMNWMNWINVKSPVCFMMLKSRIKWQDPRLLDTERSRWFVSSRTPLTNTLAHSCSAHAIVRR